MLEWHLGQPLQLAVDQTFCCSATLTAVELSSSFRDKQLLTTCPNNMIWNLTGSILYWVTMTNTVFRMGCTCRRDFEWNVHYGRSEVMYVQNGMQNGTHNGMWKRCRMECRRGIEWNVEGMQNGMCKRQRMDAE